LCSSDLYRFNEFYKNHIASIDYHKNIVVHQFYLNALQNKKRVYTKGAAIDYYKRNLVIKDLLKFNKNLFQYNDYCLFDDNCVINLDSNIAVSTDEKLLNKIIKIFKKYPPPPEPIQDPRVYMFSSRDIVCIGSGAVPFNKLNYNNDIVKDFDFTISEFDAKNPFGRLTLLQGVPGSGKTFFIRQIISAAKHAMFFYVPSDMISNIARPDTI